MFDAIITKWRSILRVASAYEMGDPLSFPDSLLDKHVFIRKAVIPAKAGIHKLLNVQDLDSR